MTITSHPIYFRGTAAVIVPYRVDGYNEANGLSVSAQNRTSEYIYLAGDYNKVELTQGSPPSPPTSFLALTHLLLHHFISSTVLVYMWYFICFGFPQFPFFFFLSLTLTFCLPTFSYTTLAAYQFFHLFLSLLAAGVVDNLQSAGFFNEKVTKSCLFTTVHDAVLFCQSTRPHSQDKVMYCSTTQMCTSTHIKHHKTFCYEVESGSNFSC